MRMNLGEYQSDIMAVLPRLDAEKVIERIWQKDHSVWKPEPTEITNRLGWLAVTDIMRQRIPELQSFAQEIRQAGFQSVVLLGMGGSSLGPEVLRSVFGKREAYPELIVLDSIDPDWILQVQNRIDLNHTLFLVSSKSGTTIEPNLLYQYFRNQVQSVVENDRGGDHFATITDEGSPLAEKAKDEGFRRIFENPSDIGGRYSVLSHFGLVPGALAGVDIPALLDKADRMQDLCRVDSLKDNPGCLLGTIMGIMALKGRDKLTLVTSPGVSRFGLWAEQLIAESTGKEGKGIIPVAGEPLVDPQYYGEDRLFVFLRLKEDENTEVDAATKAIVDSGQPIVTIEMQDTCDIGAEFFRWEYAVAVAGSILKVNPFDQPDVQRSKDATRELVKTYEETGAFPNTNPGRSLADLLVESKPGDYLAIMAYTEESDQTEEVIANFRQQVLERYQIATTFGYGPRFLHSTGQLHKGGTPNGLFLQMTVDHDEGIPIPGKSYTFSQLTNAQAMGDLKVLQQSGRKCASLHFPKKDGITIRSLTDRLP